MRLSVLLGTAAVVAASALAGPAGAEVLRYSGVTQDRLDNPEPRNWLMYRGNYQGWGYSPLDKVTAANVKELVPVWSVSTGVLEGHQSPPIVNDGVMFVSTPQAQVIALDAATGDVLWRYKRELPDDLTQLHPTNRGVALWGDTVFVATVDCFLVALDAKSGEVLWETPVDDYTKGYYMTLAPLVAKGRVMVGVSGGEYGIRGYVAAYDVNGAPEPAAGPEAAAATQASATAGAGATGPVGGADDSGAAAVAAAAPGGADGSAATGATAAAAPRGGRELWRTYTVPGPGEPGNESWPGDTWQRGGASVWITGSYDPATGVSYWGTGNASPWMPDERPGDNLYANAVMAIDVETGGLKGHHQYHHNEAWDWDEVSAPILVDLPGRDGSGTVPGMVHAGRNGYLWQLERKPQGGIGFIKAEPFVKQNVFASVDAQTGRPTYDPARIPGIGKRAEFCPSLWGGKDWPPEAYSPQTGYLYIPANENLCGHLTGTKQEYVPGEWYAGVEITDIGMTVAPGADHIGELQAWDLKTGKRAWTHNFPKSHNWGPILTTGGGLVFMGGTNDRMFRAFDARTGEILWEFKTNSGVTGVPSAFEVDGKQYIAVQSGWGVDAQRKQAILHKLIGYDAEVPQGGVVWVFALKE
jgi:alcohol dehydrogenase (cytochrome c)